ncbi:MAG: oligosaccharide flippase family protein [Bacteroidetes bacterium]|nr:oligosaccharide flippase family protein [Bacteroidota bacterium]
MSGAVRRLAKESAVYGISTIGARFLNFLLTPFYTQLFLPADFGVVSTWFSLIAFLNILFQFGLPQGYLRFAADRSGSERSSLFVSLQLVLLMVSVSFSLVLLAGHGALLTLLEFPSESFKLLPWVLIILTLDALAMIPFNQLRLENRSLAFSLVKLMNVLINLTGNVIFLVGFKTGIEGVFYANALASLFTLAVTLWLTRDHLAGRLNLGWKELWPVLVFSVPLIPTGFGTMFNEVADRLFIQNLSQETIRNWSGPVSLTNQDLVGYYSAGHKLGLFMFLIVQMFSMAWTPFFLQESKKPTFGESLSGLFRVLLIGLLVSGFLLAFFMDDVLVVSIAGYHLIPPAYWSGLVVVPWVVLAYVFNGIYVFFSYGLFLEKRSGAILIIMVSGVIITLAGNLFLLPVAGIAGSAATVFLCYLVMALMMAWMSLKTRPFSIGTGFLFRTALVMVPAWFMVFFHYHGTPLTLWLKVLISLVVIGLIFIFKLWTLNLLRLFRRPA